MNSRAKQTDFVKIGLVLVVLAILTFAAMTMTFAKYVTQGSFEDQARVAKWGINIHGNTEANLFDASYKGALPYDQSTTVESENKTDHVFAPGTAKEVPLMFIDVDGKAPEVLYDFDVSFSVRDANDENSRDYSTIALLDDHPGWKWTWRLNGTPGDIHECSTHAELEYQVNALSQKHIAPNNLPNNMVPGTNTIFIGWKYEYEDGGKTADRDKLDTLLGNMSDQGVLDGLKVDLNVSATQCLDSNDNIYSVSFDTVGGSKNPDVQFVKGNQLVKEPDVPPTKEHWSFAGWYEPVIDRLWDFDSDTVVDHNVILYAQWDPDESPEIHPSGITWDQSIDIIRSDTHDFSVSAVSPGAITAWSEKPDYVSVEKISQANDSHTAHFRVKALQLFKDPVKITVHIAESGYYYEETHNFWVSVTTKKIHYDGGDPITGLTYKEGQEQELLNPVVVTEPDTGCTVTYAQSDSSSADPETLEWKTTVPVGQDVQPYYVWFRIHSADIHYLDIMSSMQTVYISQADSSSWTEPVKANDASYTGKDYPLLSQEGTTSGDTETMKYMAVFNDPTVPEKTDPSWSSFVPTGKEVGTYYVYWMIDGGKHYKGTNVSSPMVVNIEKSSAKYTDPTGSPVTFYVKDRDYPLIQTPGDASDGQTMYYYMKVDSSVAPTGDETEGWTTDYASLTGYDAAKYYVWWKTDGGSSYEPSGVKGMIEVDILKSPAVYKDPSLAIDASYKEGEDYKLIEKDGVASDGQQMYYITKYDASDIVPTAPADADPSWTTNSADVTGNEVGYHFVWIKTTGGKNYDSLVTTYIGRVYIGKAASEGYTRLEVTDDASWTGQDQQLIETPATAAGDTEYVEYNVTTVNTPPAIDGPNWTDDYTEIKGKAAGTYYVWYKIVGGKHYLGSGVLGPVSRSIGQTLAYVFPVPNGENIDFKLDNNKAPQMQDLLDLDNMQKFGGDVVFGIGTATQAPVTWSSVGEIPQASEVGSYYLWYKMVNVDGNHYWPEGLAEPCNSAAVINKIDRPADLGTTLTVSNKMFVKVGNSAVTAKATVDGFYQGESDTFDFVSNDTNVATITQATSSTNPATINPVAGNAGETKTIKVTIHNKNLNDYTIDNVPITVDDFTYSAVSLYENEDAKNAENEMILDRVHAQAEADKAEKSDVENFFNDLFGLNSPDPELPDANGSVTVTSYVPYKDPGSVTLTIPNQVTWSDGKTKHNIVGVGDGTNSILASKGKAITGLVIGENNSSKVASLSKNAFSGTTKLQASGIKINSTIVKGINSAAFNAGIMKPETGNKYITDSTGKYILGCTKDYSTACFTIPGNILSIADSAFASNTKIIKVKVNRASTDKKSSCSIYVGNSAFKSCSNLENFVIMAEDDYDKTTYGSTDPFASAGHAAGTKGAALIFAGGKGIKANKSTALSYQVAVLNSKNRISCADGKYECLEQDFSTSTYNYAYGNSCIDLNGHTLSRSNTSSPIDRGVVLVIQKNSAGKAANVRLDNTANINTTYNSKGQIKGGNNKTNGDSTSASQFTGGGICVYQGTLNIANGNIYGNKSIKGGGVSVVSQERPCGALDKSTLNIYGGVISSNHAEPDSEYCGGGGIDAETGTTVNMYKGKIIRNEVWYTNGRGGGISMVGSGTYKSTLHIYGGTIGATSAKTSGDQKGDWNEATSWGAAIYLKNTSTSTSAKSNVTCTLDKGTMGYYNYIYTATSRSCIKNVNCTLTNNAGTSAWTVD